MALIRTALALLGALSLAGISPACAEASKVRLARQFGISYLPLTLMEENKLFEKNAKAAGLDVTTEWVQFSAGTIITLQLTGQQIYSDVLCSSDTPPVSGCTFPLTQPMTVHVTGVEP